MKNCIYELSPSLLIQVTSACCHDFVLLQAISLDPDNSNYRENLQVVQERMDQPEASAQNTSQEQPMPHSQGEGGGGGGGEKGGC